MPLSAELRTAAMVAYRELLHCARAPARVVTTLILPLTFLLILGVGLNSLVGGGEGGVNFVQFMLPGVVVMSVVTVALQAGVSVVVDREFGFLREMLVAPPSRVSLITGKIAGGAIVATAQGILLLLFAPLVGVSLHPLAVAGVIGIAVLVAVSFTALGVFLATHIRRMESFQAILMFVLMPMVFLSGAMFPLQGLPTWLSILAHLNPLTYAVDPLRQVVFAEHGIEPAASGRFATGVEWFGYSLPVIAELGIVAAVAALFTALSVRKFGKPE